MPGNLCTSAGLLFADGSARRDAHRTDTFRAYHVPLVMFATRITEAKAVEQRDFNPYTAAMEVWQAAMLNAFELAGKAALLWTGVPSSPGGESRRLAAVDPKWSSLVASAMETHQRLEARAANAYALSLELGKTTLRNVEAATIDRGTVDPSLLRRSA